MLERQNNFLEKQAEYSHEKAIIFDMMIELAEKEYNIAIRKNSSPGLLTPTQKKGEKHNLLLWISRE